jgi:hypothetical protein
MVLVLSDWSNAEWHCQYVREGFANAFVGREATARIRLRAEYKETLQARSSDSRQTEHEGSIARRVQRLIK